MNVPMPLCYYANQSGGGGEHSDSGNTEGHTDTNSSTNGGTNTSDGSANTITDTRTSSANNNYEQHAGGDDAQSDQQEGVSYQGGYCLCARTVFADNFPVAIGGSGGRILVENLPLCFNTYNFARDVLVGIT